MDRQINLDPDNTRRANVIRVKYGQVWADRFTTAIALARMTAENADENAIAKQVVSHYHSAASVLHKKADVNAANDIWFLAEELISRVLSEWMIDQIEGHLKTLH